MNPLTNMKNVVKLSEQEFKNTSKSSWHDQYKDSAWIFVGGLPYDLTEGDIICIFSQYGEVVNINLIREKATGKSRGFCFLCYEDQRSTILSVDNFNGIKILKRTIRVDHVQDYKVPKEGKKTDEETKKLYAEGCAPKAAPIIPKKEPPQQDLRETLADQIEGDIKLPARLPIYTTIKSDQISEGEAEKKITKEKKRKKNKKDKKKKSKKGKSKQSESNSDETNSSDSESRKSNFKIKIEKRDGRLSSEERDKRKRDRNDRDKYIGSKNDEYSTSSSKYSSSYRSEKYNFTKDYPPSIIRGQKSSLKRSDRSRSRDRIGKPRSYKRDISPDIPKRWR